MLTVADLGPHKSAIHETKCTWYNIYANLKSLIITFSTPGLTYYPIAPSSVCEVLYTHDAVSTVAVNHICSH